MQLGDDLHDEYQNRMCDLCERYILECKSMTSTFICEGCKCEDALEWLKEDIIEEIYDKRWYWRLWWWIVKLFK